MDTTALKTRMALPAAGRQSERVARILALVGGPDILDVGCASHRPNPDSPHWLHGHLLRAFPEANVVGFDLDAGQVAILHDAGFGHVTVGDAEHMNLGQRFDTIVAGELLEHLSKPAAFLGKAREHLKPGGRVILTTPFPFSLYYGLRALTRFPQTCANPEHTCWFCPTTIRELAARAGLRVAAVDLIEHYHFGARYSLAYWSFTTALFVGRHILPKRLRCNEMLVTLVPA